MRRQGSKHEIWTNGSEEKVKIMRLEVKLKKKGSFWLIEAPALDVMTQGKTIKEACIMLKDAVQLLANKKGIKVTIFSGRKGSEAFLSVKDHDSLIALLIRRQRQKYGLTLKEAAKRIGSNSANSFARYEQGKARPTVSKLFELISAINPKSDPVLWISN